MKDKSEGMGNGKARKQSCSRLHSKKLPFFFLLSTFGGTVQEGVIRPRPPDARLKGALTGSYFVERHLVNSPTYVTMCSDKTV